MNNTKSHIPYNKPFMTGRELHYISQAHSNGKLAGDGYLRNCAMHGCKIIRDVKKHY